MERIPLLLFSDAVSSPTGLARITRELAIRIAANLGDVFELATVGHGGCGNYHLPFKQYSWTFSDDWIIRDLPDVWADFAGERKGIVLTVHDPSRMLWFSRPETCIDNRIRQYLEHAPFKKWGYFAIDASGPNGKLSGMLRECLLGYDRVLCYSQWAEKIILSTLGISAAEDRDLQSIPHGIDTDVFYPRGRKWRQLFGNIITNGKFPLSIEDDELLVGIVATNQFRKDYGTVIQVCSELAKQRKIRLWIHTDRMDNTWSIPNLLSDFGLNTKAISPMVSLMQHSDDTMAKLYSACDVTLAPGCSEGFGYPIFESLACGTPAIHGDNGGAPEHMCKCMLVPPVAWRFEGIWNCVRPVFSAEGWIKAIDTVTTPPLSEIKLPDHLAWKQLWPRWERWFRKGVQCAT